MSNKVDIVISWVDGDDPEWVAEKQRYTSEIDNKVDEKRARYRDWDNVQYIFRGIEKFAPWVNKIFFVTYGHLPAWLDVTNPKLVVVKHEDFIPKEYLPTFSSTTIEFNFHRIEGLSDNFVYFNDDMFLIRHTKESDFFTKDKPCDSAVLNAISIGRIPNEKKLFLAPVINMSIINSYFDKSSTIKEKPLNWYNLKYSKNLLRTIALLPWRHFTGFVNWHLPYSIKKSTLEEVWKLENDVLDNTCKHRFRKEDDPNIWLFIYWQYAKNNFKPRSPKIGGEFGISDDVESNKKIIEKIMKSKFKVVCLNDAVSDTGVFEDCKEMVNNMLESILPDKCSFEK